MKCSEFIVLLDDLAVLYGNSDISASIDEIRMLRNILSLAPAKNVQALAKQLEPAKSALPVSDQPYPFVTSLAHLLQTYGKPAVAKDAATLAGLVRGLDSAGICQLIERAIAKPRSSKSGATAQPKQAVRLDLIASFHRRLESTLGDDPGFKAVVAEIESDSSLTTAEFSVLSKDFSLKTANTRAAALKNIRARHQNLMTSRAKSAATAGRVAG